MKPIVLVAYGGGHVTMLAPIAQALHKRKTPVIFLALTTARTHLDRLNIPYISYQNLPGAQDPDVQKWGRELSSDLPKNSVVPIEESIAYLGLNYQDLIFQLGVKGASIAYQEKGRHAFLPLTLFRRWFNAIQPRLIVATNSPRSERAALEVAGELGIPKICIVDVFGMQELQWIKRPGYADRICVLNEQVKNMFVQAGQRPEALVVTGNPAFERLQQPPVQAAGRALRLARSWHKDECVVLWASQVEPTKHPFTDRQGDPSLPLRAETWLRKFVTQYPNFRLVIRYHPSDQRIFEDGQARVEQSTHNEDLSVLLNAVDIVVILTSTVGLEAYLAGRHVISITGSIFDTDVPYKAMGITAENVASYDALASALLRLCTIKSPLPVMQVCHTPTQKIISVIDALIDR